MMKPVRIVAALIAVVAAVLLASPGAVAGPDTTLAAAASETGLTLAQTMRQAVPADQELSPRMQRLLAGGDRRGARALARQIGVPPGGAQPYTCSEGSCACAGVSDCVNMIAGEGKCAEGSTSCNVNGCTCAEAN